MELTCIMCPMGCRLTCTQKDGEIIVTGNNCNRGETFAKDELTNPKRIVTALVKTSKGVASIKTTKPVDKKLINTVMAELDKVYVKNPNFGDVIIKNICNSGADIVITKNYN